MNKPEILIIDDEEQIRKLLDITLRSNNYSVTQGSNGQRGNYYGLKSSSRI
jgi:two-component system KDP operon response regulator KdpE